MNVNGVMRIQIIAQGRQAQAQMAAMQRQVGGLNRQLGAGTIAGQRFQQIFRPGYLERWAKNLQWTGRQIEYNFTLPVAIASGFATKWALDVESAMTRLRKVYGDHNTSAEVVRRDTEQLGQAFEALSNHFGVVQSDVAGIGATWAQAGARGVQVARSTRASLELMILGEMEAEEATRALIAIQSQYRLSTEDLRQAVADLNAVENNTATTLPDLVRVIERSGAAARNAGVPIRELAAMTAALVPATGTAERAGNALRTIITRLMVPTGAARDLFREIGIEVDTAGWNSLNFRERLMRLAQTFEGLNSAQRASVSTQAAGVFQVSRFGTLMADVTDEAGWYQRALDATSDSTQTLADYTREIATYLESDPQGFRILTARLQNLLIRVIKPLIPALLGIFSRVVKLVESFANLDPRLQQVILGFVFFIALVGPLVRYTGALALLLLRLGAAFGFVFKTAHVAMDGLATLLTLLRQYATFPFDAVAAVGSATFSVIGAAARGSGRLIVSAFLGVHGALVGIFSRLPAVLGAVVSGVALMWRGIMASSLAAYRGLAWLFASFPALALAADAAIGRAMAATALFMRRLWVATGTGLVTAFRALGTAAAVTWGAVNAALLAAWNATAVAVVAIQAGLMRAVAAGQLLAFRLIGGGLVAAILLPVGRALIAVQVLFTQAMMRLPGLAYTAWVAVGTAANAMAEGVLVAMRGVRTAFLVGTWWIMEAWLRLIALMSRAWAAMWPALAAISRRGSLLVASGLGALWTAFAGLPTLLARIPRLFALMFLAIRVQLAGAAAAFVMWQTVTGAAMRTFIRNLFAMQWATALNMKGIALAIGRGAVWFARALFGWPGLIAAAVAAIVVIFRDRIGEAIDWLSEKFFDLPRAAGTALRMVLDFFKSVARAIAQIVRFIINPFAGIGGSSGPTPAVTTGAPERTGGPQAMAKGGEVEGKGFRDTVPALLTPGEFVVRRDGSNLQEAVQYFKERDTDVVAMARGGEVVAQHVQRFQRGGLVEMDRRETIRLSNSSPANRLGGAAPATPVTTAAAATAPVTGGGDATVQTNTPQVQAMSAAVENLEGKIDGMERSVDAANRAIDVQNLILDDLRAQADATRESLDAARESMQQWADTPIQGMRAMSDAIFDNEMAQKRLRLEMLRFEETHGAIDDTKDRLNALGTDIESLYEERRSLTMMGAGGDVLGVIDRRIDAMEAEYHQLENATGQAENASAQYERMEAELENLQRRGEILNLEESLRFDPLTRQIDQAATSMREMPFETILSNVQAQRAEVERLTPVWERQNAAVEAQQQVVDSMSRTRDEAQRSIDIEKDRLGELQAAYEDAGGAAEALSDHVEAFRNLEGAEDWDIPGGTMSVEGLDELGNIEDFIAELQGEIEDEFGNLDLFKPIKDAWETVVEWMRNNASLLWSALFGGLFGVMAKLGHAVLAVLTSGMTAVGIGVGKFAGPLGIAIGAMLGVAVGLAWQWFQSNVGWEGLQEWFNSSPIGEMMGTLLPPIERFIYRVQHMWSYFVRQFADEMEKWGPVLEHAKGAFENIANGIMYVVNWLIEQFSTKGSVLRGIWDQIWKGITHIVLPFIRMIGEVILGLFGIIRNVFGLIFALIDGDWRAAWQYAQDIFGSIWDTIFGLVRGIVGIIHGVVRSLVDGIVNFFQWLFDKLVGNSIIPELINGIVAWFQGLPNRVVVFVQDLVNRVVTWFTDLVARTWEKFGQMRDAVRDRLGDILKRVIVWIADLRERWSTFWQGLFDKVSEIAASILEKVKALLGWNGGLRELISNAVTAIGTLWDRIRKKFADPINFVIGTVYNRGIRRLWNFIAERVGLGTLPEVQRVELKRGGRVPGSGAMDTVPALLTPGEFVVTASGDNLSAAVEYFGRPEVMPPPLEASARRGGDEAPQHFRQGGQVGRILANVASPARNSSNQSPESAPQRFQAGGVVGQTTGLNQQFLGWLNAWSRAIRTRISVTSGYRTHAQQAALYRQKPGLAAPPGRSNHEYGLAADIIPQLGGTSRGNQARQFAMHFPMSYEPWHIEPINARAMRSGGGGGGVVGFLMDAVADLADRFLGPVRERVTEFREQGPIQNMIGAGAVTLMDAAVDHFRRKEEDGSLYGDLGAPPGNPRQADARQVRSNVELGRQIAAARYGWTGHQWNSLYRLWQGESNWNHLARNQSSGAYGIPQSLPANKMASHGSDWRTNPRTQILWGADYIRNRYGGPSEAYRIWQRRQPHWYAAGGPVDESIMRQGRDSVPAMLTPGEFVVDAKGGNLQEAIRYYDPRYMAAGGPVTRGAAPTVTLAGSDSDLQASESVSQDNSHTENHYHFGDLSFPNVRSGGDAEAFVRNLNQLVGASED